jgi:GST-like protein
MFEELLAAGFKGAEYDAWLINIGKATSSARASSTINPNSKIPALLDPQRRDADAACSNPARS